MRRLPIGSPTGRSRWAQSPLRQRTHFIAEHLEPRLLLILDSNAVLLANPSLADKVGNDLAFLSANYTAAAGPQLQGVSGGYTPSALQPNAAILNLNGNRIQINAISQNAQTNALAQELTNAGADVIGVFGAMVSANLPISLIGQLANLPDLNFARPAYTPQISAQVEDQGTQALATDIGSKRFGVDGTGVTIGVISDSFNNLSGYAADVASGDLPAAVNILSDIASGGTDEGRGMAQIIHHLAPGSPIAFHTAYIGEANFAQGILDLANAGAKVITDDVMYYDEPMFQDGILAQAINTAVTTKGVSYFSSAGNSAHNAYQSAFSATSAPFTISGASNVYHNFNPGGAADALQPITINAGGTITLSFQWDQPYASAGGATCQSNVNIYLMNSSTTVLTAATTNNIGHDPIELLSYTNPSTSAATTVYLAVNLKSGAAPGTMKYVLFGSGSIAGYATNTGAEYGHSLAANAAGVGAAAYWKTPAYGVSPATLESFSSAGGTPILFGPSGSRLATPDYRPQPRFVAVDGSDTTFFGGSDAEPNGLPNFFGTSAAAPHAAAVAALLKQASPSLTASQIYTTLQNTALDMAATGFDYDTGYGLIQADSALTSVLGGSISGSAFRDYNNNGIRDAGEPAHQGVTILLDSNANGQVNTGVSAPLASLDVPKAIADFGTQAANFPSRNISSLTVTGLTGRVTKVTVKLSVTHSYDQDIGLTLISPSGMRVQLADNVGSSGKNFTNTTFDDAATTNILSGSAPFTGLFRPQAKLAALNGENPNGLWQLEIRDFAATDTGTLTAWSLTISYADPATTTDAAGNFSFAGLAPSAYYGIYHLRELTPPGFTLSAPLLPLDLNLAPAVQSTGNIFANYAPVPTVLAINRNSANPTNATSVGFAIGFSQSVTGVDATDLVLATSGVTGTINSVTGGGSSYTVTVTGITGNGTLGLNLIDNDTIQDALANPLGGVGLGNGNFTGQLFTIDNTPPAVTQPQLAPGNDSGYSATDNITNITLPTFTAQAETGSTVRIFNDAVQVGSGIAAAGTYSITPATALSPGIHHITATATDAAGNTSAPTSALLITIDTALPLLSGMESAALVYTEKDPATPITASLAVTDIDSASLAAASVAITTGLATGQDILGFANQNGISGSYSLTTGILTLVGLSSPANYQTALRSVTYLNTSVNPSTLGRTVSFVATDIAGNTSIASGRNITLLAVNDPPVIQSLIATPSPVVQGQDLLLAANGVSDPDSPVADVKFYRETNGIPGLQTDAGGDLLLAIAADRGSGYTTTLNTTTLPLGTYTYYAQATDLPGLSGNVVQTTNTVVQTPTITGTDGNDTYYVRLSLDAQSVLVWTNATADGSPAYTYPLATLYGLTFHTAGGDDSLIVDFANGNPIPSGQLAYEGGTGTNSLTIQGTTATSDLTINTGQVLFGTSPITLTDVSSILLDSAAGQPVLLNSLTINNPVVTLSPTAGKLLRTNALSIGAAGRLNLGNGSLIVDVPTATPIPADVATTIGGYVRFGQLVAGSTNSNWGLAVMLNSDAAGNQLFGAFVNQSSITNRSILVKYALHGDSDLNGVINGDDYFRIDAGLLRQQLGYRNGDFNYDNIINADDYFAIDSAFLSQTLPLAAPVFAASAKSIN